MSSDRSVAIDYSLYITGENRRSDSVVRVIIVVSGCISKKEFIIIVESGIEMNVNCALVRAAIIIAMDFSERERELEEKIEVNVFYIIIIHEVYTMMI